MKSLKLIICLIVITSLFLQIQGRIKKSNKTLSTTKKGILDRLFGTWNEVQVQVINSVGETLNFKGLLMIVYYDGNKDEYPLGIGFKDLQQISKTDKTSFISKVIQSESTTNSGIVPTLDFRLIKDCSFRDNAGEWFSDWRYEFEVYGKEQYYLDKSVYTNKKSTWTIKMELPAFGKKDAVQTKAELYQLCQKRSTNMNTLKTIAEQKGDAYRGAKDVLEQKKISLNQQAKVKGNKEQIVSAVQSQAQKKEADIDSLIAANTQKLNDALKKLQSLSSSQLSAQSQVESYNSQLDAVKLDLEALQQNAQNVSQQIKFTQQQLNEANNLQENQKLQQKQLIEEKDKIITSGSTEQQEINNLIKEQEEKIKQLQSNLAKKQQEQAALLKVNQEKSSTVTQNIASTTNTIADLKKVLELQQKQNADIQEQTRVTEQSINEVQNKLNEQRKLSDQLISQLQQESQLKIQQEKEFTNVENQQKAQLASLKDTLLAETKDLTGQTQNYNELAQQVELASTKATNTYNDYDQALKNINRVASAAVDRTKLALTNINDDVFRNHIQAIQSNTLQSMTTAKRRLAKIQQDRQRLQKILKQQRNLRLQKKSHKQSKLQKKIQKKRQ